MGLPLSLFRALLLVAAWDFTVSASEEPPPGPPFSVQCHMVALPAKMLTQVLPGLADDEKAEAAWKALQAQIGQGEVALTAVLSTQGRCGAKLAVSSLEEFRYATEYDPPLLPDPTRASIAKEVLEAWPWVGATPTQFSAQNLGQTLELFATLTPEGRIACGYEISHTRLESMAKIDGGVLAKGERTFLEQPIFSSLKDTSETVLLNGKPKLIGVHRLPGAEARYELFVLTVTLGTAPAN